MELVTILVPTFTGIILLTACIRCYRKKRNQSISAPTLEPVILPVKYTQSYPSYTYTTGQPMTPPVSSYPASSYQNNSFTTVPLPPPVNPYAVMQPTTAVPVYIPADAYTQKQGVGGQGYLQPVPVYTQNTQFIS